MDKEKNREATEDTPPVNETLHPPSKHHHSILTASLILVIAAGAAYGVYASEQSKAAKITSQNSSLNNQIAALNREIKQQNNINDDVVAKSKVYQDPSGGIGLVNGAVTFTLPSGWKRVPASFCGGYSIGSKAVCQDVAAVAPSTLIASDGPSTWSATIEVYNYTSSNGSAASWYENVDGGDPLTDNGAPEAINVSQLPINGYSALSTLIASPETPPTPPDYTNAIFVVVRGSYAVVVSAVVQTNTGYEANVAFDYRTTYLPVLAKMVQTIRFQD